MDDQFRRDRVGVVHRDHGGVRRVDAGHGNRPSGVLDRLDDVDLGDVLRAGFSVTSRADGQTSGVVGEGNSGSRPVDRYRIAATSLNADAGLGRTSVCIGQVARTIGEAGAGGGTETVCEWVWPGSVTPWVCAGWDALWTWPGSVRA